MHANDVSKMQVVCQTFVFALVLTNDLALLRELERQGQRKREKVMSTG